MNANRLISMAVAAALAIGGIAVSSPTRAAAATSLTRAQFELMSGDKTKAQVEAVIGVLGEPAWVQSQFASCGGDEGPFYGYRFSTSAQEFGGAEVIIQFREDQSGPNLGDGWNSFTYLFYPFCIERGWDGTKATDTLVEVYDGAWKDVDRETVTVPDEVWSGGGWSQVDAVAGSVTKLARLDLTSVSQLTRVHISCQNVQREEDHCSLSELILGNHPRLTDIYVPMSRLTSLNTSGAPHLTSLVVRYNKLTNLNVSVNADLTWLEAEDNALKALDASANPLLAGLILTGNKLRALNVSKNPKLTDLYVDGNASLGKMSFSNNRKLKELSVFGCGKWPSKLNYSKLNKLQELIVGPKKLSKKHLPSRLRHVRPSKVPHGGWDYVR